MAEYNHRQRLQEGARPWNEWRAANPDVIPDLRYLELSLGQRQFGPINGGPIDLRAALLFKADLRNATLIEADLRDAELVEAEFGGARLDNADLRGAKLVDSSLIGADFARAKLDGADLTGADLTSARNLSQQQIDTAIGDITTQLPFDLVMPKSWIVPKASAGPKLPGDLPSEDSALVSNDLYGILGAKKTDSDETIHAVYRVKAKSLHPDLNPGSAGAEDAFRRLTYAYAILRDPERRKRYDRGEIGADGEETEAYRYSVWRAARMRRFRMVAAITAAVTTVSCLVIFTQFSSFGSWFGRSETGAPPQEIAVSPARQDMSLEVAPSPARSKIQSRMEAESEELVPVKADEADRQEERAQDAAPQQVNPSENTFALKAEEPANPAPEPEAPTSESAASPAAPSDAQSNAEAIIERNGTSAAEVQEQPSSPPEIEQASLQPPAETPNASAPAVEILATPLVLPLPASNALGPRLYKSLEPTPLLKSKMAPKFMVLGLAAQPEAPPPPRFVICRAPGASASGTFDWVVKFRMGESPCRRAKFSPVDKIIPKQTRKIPAPSYQTRLDPDEQKNSASPPPVTAAPAVAPPRKSSDISSDVLSGGL